MYKNNAKSSPIDIQPGTYLRLLKDIEKELPKLLEDESSWQTLDISYELPRVERLWHQHGNYRIYLHRIYPTDPNKALFHPHPWPSSMRILHGTYEMGIGFGSKEQKPPITTTFLLGENSIYEMIHPHGWHYVCPINDVVYSLMIAGNPWPAEGEKSSLDLQPLLTAVKLEILKFFRKRYS